VLNDFEVAAALFRGVVEYFKADSGLQIVPGIKGVDQDVSACLIQDSLKGPGCSADNENAQEWRCQRAMG